MTWSVVEELGHGLQEDKRKTEEHKLTNANQNYRDILHLHTDQYWIENFVFFQRVNR